MKENTKRQREKWENLSAVIKPKTLVKHQLCVREVKSPVGILVWKAENSAMKI